MRFKMICLLGLVLAGLFLSGCASNNAVTLVNKPDRSLVVVPVKGQPICVRSIHNSTIIGFGAIGGTIEQAVTTSSSEALCSRLNQYIDFNGERILAEECAKLLQASPKVAFHDVAVHPLDSVMPGVKDMESNEQQRFKVNSPNISKWNSNFSNWKKSPPVAEKLASTGQRVVFLEVTFHCVFLNHRNKIDPANIYMRVMDPETGETLGFSSFFEGYDINEVTESSNLQTFESDFRKCMNKCAHTGLRDLNLL